MTTTPDRWPDAPQLPMWATDRLILRCDGDAGRCEFYVRGGHSPDSRPTFSPELAAERIAQLWGLGLQHSRDTGHMPRIMQHSVAYVIED
jgi:hypothetical protein